MAVDRNEETEKIMSDADRNKNGVCRHLMRLNEEWDNMEMSGTNYLTKTDVKTSLFTAGAADVLNDSGSTEQEEVSGITMTSVLFCRHGGLIMPETSGQIYTECPTCITGISKKGLRAIMALEVLNKFSRKYLVIDDDGKLIGIKPHLAGDGQVTVGFGDCLLGNDIDFYLEESRKKRLNGYLSDQVSEYSKMKDTVIPVDICMEKLLQDIEVFNQSVKEQFIDQGFMLTQSQFDAIVIAKYQCYSLGEKASNAIKAGEKREVLYELFLKAHGTNGGFESRTNTEMNIYYDAAYTVNGELDDVVVEPLDEL